MLAVRASFDAVPMQLGGSPTPRASWDASCASIVHQQLALGALAQQQAAVAAALAASAQPPSWGQGGAADRASLDSQFSQLSLVADGRQAGVQGGQRTSLESLMSLGGRSSLDPAHSWEGSLASPHMLLSQQAALRGCEPPEAHPAVDAFQSAFYASPAAAAHPAQRSSAQPPAGTPLHDGGEQPPLLHPRPRRSF
jgi:hypothetical protein